MEWPYYTLKNGRLLDEDGDDCLESPNFKNAYEAEAWLVENDIRGTIN